MCEDTKLKAIHNGLGKQKINELLSSMCEDTKLKAIHNRNNICRYCRIVVFNVQRY